MSLSPLTPQQKEFKLQVHVVNMHAQYFPHVCMIAFPGRPGDAKDGFFKKKMGVRPGVSDIILWWSHTYPLWAVKWLMQMRDYCGFGFALMHSGVIELKVDAKISSAQNKFLSRINGLGGCHQVCHSWQEYYKTLCKWGIKPVYICTTFAEPDYSTWDEKLAAVHNFFAP